MSVIGLWADSGGLIPDNQKKKVPSDRFPALPTAGMQRHWTSQTEGPGVRPLYSPTAGLTAPGSMHRDPPQVCPCSGSEARNGLSLASNEDCFHNLHSRVKVPDLLLRSPVRCLFCPFGSQLRHPNEFAPARAVSLHRTRCRFRNSPGLTALPASTPLRDFYIPRDQSVLPDLLPANPPSESARSPFAPRSRFLSLVFRLRIIVPGPLHLRRLAVPQTSWNQSQYAPEASDRQCHSCILEHLSSGFFPVYF